MKESERFEFSEWEKAFERYDELHKIHGDNIRMVNSQHDYSMGIWIEPIGNELAPMEDFAYNTKESVEAYRQRIITAISKNKHPETVL